MKRFFAFACLALSLCLPARYAHAVLVNFDSIDASAGAVEGAPVVDYLAGFGITLIAPGLTPTILQTQGDQVPAPSLPNYFGVGGPGGGFTYTFYFAGPVNSVSFTTPALGSGSTMAEFTATAYSASNSVLSQVHRALSGPNVAQATWTLNGPNIDHIEFFSSVHFFAGSNLIFDDFTFTPAPTTQCDTDLAAAQQEVQTLQTSLTQCQATSSQLQGQVNTLTNANALLQSQVNTLTTTNAQLTTQLQAANTTITGGVLSVQQNLATTFNDPQFTIPGATAAQQLQNLVNAINALNPGRKQGIYQNLGGKK